MNHFDISQAQPRAWKQLSRSAGRGRIGSAYLLHGTDGLGHWPLGLKLAALLNCESPREDESDDQVKHPCLQCRNCKAHFSLNFPDFVPVVPIAAQKKAGDMIDLVSEALQARKNEPYLRPALAKNMSISIEAVRRLKIVLSRKSDMGAHRVVLIDQVEKMLPAAADAMLKTLEEPPHDTTIILTTNNPDSLSTTISSRCRKVRLARTPVDAIARYLQERYSMTDEKSRRIAHIAQGNTGEAILLADQSGEHDQANRVVVFRAFRSILTDDSPEAVSVVSEAISSNDKNQVEQMLRLWQSFIRDCAYVAASSDETGIVNRDFQSDIIKLSAKFDSSGLAPFMLGEIKNTLAELRRNVHIQGALVALSLRFNSHVRMAG